MTLSLIPIHQPGGWIDGVPAWFDWKHERKRHRCDPSAHTVDWAQTLLERASTKLFGDLRIFNRVIQILVELQTMVIQR